MNESNKCIYVKNTMDGYIILCLYVDDILIVGNKDQMIKFTKNMLNFKFDKKDMSLAGLILKIKTIR